MVNKEDLGIDGIILYSNTFDQLSAGETTDEISIKGVKLHNFSITIASIGTSVTVRAEYSNDGTNWGNMNDNLVDTTLTANGTYQLNKVNFPTKYVRFVFVSEVGSGATIDVDYLGDA